MLFSCSPIWECFIKQRILFTWRNPFQAVTMLSVGRRIRIVSLWLEGLTAQDISVKSGVSVSTVYRWIRRWQKEGSIKSWSSQARLRTRSWQHLDLYSRMFADRHYLGVQPIHLCPKNSVYNMMAPQRYSQAGDSKISGQEHREKCRQNVIPSLWSS